MPDAVLADGPVAYWRMGRVESQTLVPDESGKAGPLVLSAAKTGEPGIFDDDPAMAFDGKNAFAEATSSATLQFEGTSPYTIEAWVRFEGVANVGEYLQTIVGFSEGASGSEQQNGYHLYIRNDTPATMRGWRDSFSATSAQAESPIAPKGSWGHHVMTFDGTTVRMYFDGQPMGTAPMPGSISIRDAAKLTVGRRS